MSIKFGSLLGGVVVFPTGVVQFAAEAAVFSGTRGGSAPESEPWTDMGGQFYVRIALLGASF